MNRLEFSFFPPLSPGLSTMPHKIIAIGEVLWDMLPGGRKVGGAPGNFAFHCSQLGADTAMISAVGDDELGRELLDYYTQMGLSTELIEVVPDMPTGTVGVEILNGQPEYTIFENVAWDRIIVTRRHLDRAAEADVVYFGSLVCRSETTRSSVQKLIAAAPDRAMKVCDINLRAPFYSIETLRPLLEAADVLKLNDNEIGILGDMFEAPAGSVEEKARWFVEKYGYRLLAVTLGPEGALLVSPSETSRYRARPVEVVDTVGAGDSFAAQTVVGLLGGLSLGEINRRANELAAFVCTNRGGTPKHPSAS